MGSWWHLRAEILVSAIREFIGCGRSSVSTERPRHLAQHSRQFGLVAVLQNTVDDFERERRVAAVQLGHRFVMGSAFHQPTSASSSSNARRLTRDAAPYLVDRYSERKESAEALSRRVQQTAI